MLTMLPDAGVVEAGAETIALAEGLGVDPELFFKAIRGGALDLPYLSGQRTCRGAGGGRLDNLAPVRGELLFGALERVLPAALAEL